MIGGVYWPLEIEPQFMKKMADFVPQTWAMREFTELIAKGGSSSDIMSYTGILLIFAVVFFGIGLTRFILASYYGTCTQMLRNRLYRNYLINLSQVKKAAFLLELASFLNLDFVRKQKVCLVS